MLRELFSICLDSRLKPTEELAYKYKACDESYSCCDHNAFSFFLFVNDCGASCGCSVNCSLFVCLILLFIVLFVQPVCFLIASAKLRRNPNMANNSPTLT